MSIQWWSPVCNLFQSKQHSNADHLKLVIRLDSELLDTFPKMTIVVYASSNEWSLFSIPIALATSLVYIETRRNPWAILFGILQKQRGQSEWSQAKRCYWFGSMWAGRFGAEIGASESKISIHVWCKNATTHILLGGQLWRGHECMGQLYLWSV